MNNCLWIQTGHEADKCYYSKSFRLKCPISALSICKRNGFHMEARILRYSNFGWQWFSAMPAQHNHLKILRPRSTPIAFGLIGLGCKPGNGIFKSSQVILICSQRGHPLPFICTRIIWGTCGMVPSQITACNTQLETPLWKKTQSSPQKEIL